MSNRNSAIGSATVLHPKHNRILHHSAKGNAVEKIEEEETEEKKTGRSWWWWWWWCSSRNSAGSIHIGGIIMLFYIILYNITLRIPVAVFVCFRIGFSACRKKTHI